MGWVYEGHILLLLLRTKSCDININLSWKVKKTSQPCKWKKKVVTSVIHLS